MGLSFGGGITISGGITFTSLPPLPPFDAADYANNLNNFSPAISADKAYDISSWTGASWEVTNNAASFTPTVYSIVLAQAATALASSNITVTGATATTGTCDRFQNPRMGRFTPDGKYFFVSYSTLSSANFGGIIKRPCYAAYSLPWDMNQKTSAEMEALIDQALFLESDDGTASDITDFMFSPDGTKLIYLDFNHNDLKSYTLSTGYDLSTATEDATAIDASNGDTTTATRLDINKEGTKIWVISDGARIHQLTMSTAWDLSTATHTHNLVLENGSGAAIDSGIPQGLLWASSDYLSFWFRGSTNDNFHKYTLTTAWDLSSVSNSNATATHTTGRAVSADRSGLGGNHYATVNPGHYVTEMITSTICGITSSGGVNTTVQGEQGQGYAAAFNNDGSRIWLFDRQYDELTEYQLSTAYDITDIGPSASGRVEYTITGVDGYQMQFDHNGADKIWFLNRSDDYLYEIPLNNGSLNGAAAFSTSTNTKVLVSGADATPRTFFVAQDYLYVIGDTNDTLMRAPLSTPYDITSAGTFTSGYDFFTNDGNSFIASMWISNDGYTLFIADDSPTDLLAKYTFGTAWDHTTLTKDWSLPGLQNANSLSNLAPSTQILGFQLNYEGTHLIIYDNLEGVRHWTIQENQTAIAGAPPVVGLTPLSTDADLSALTLSSGTLSPTFSASTTSYTVTVPNATSSITVTPTASDSGALITVNGTAVASGSASGSIALSVGENTITVKVVSANGTPKTYTTVATRSAETGDDLPDPSNPVVEGVLIRADMNTYIEDIAWDTANNIMYALSQDGARIERYSISNGTWTYTNVSNTSLTNLHKIFYDPYIDKVVVTDSTTTGTTRWLDPDDLTQVGSYTNANAEKSTYVPVTSSRAWLFPGDYAGDSNNIGIIVNVTDPTSPGFARYESYTGFREGYYFRAQAISGATTIQGYFMLNSTTVLYGINTTDPDNWSRNLPFTLRDTGGTTIADGQRVFGFSLFGGTDFVCVLTNTTDDNTIYFYDCAEDSGNASYPIHASTTWNADYQLDFGAGVTVYGVTAKDSYLYVRTNSKIAVYDCTDMSSITEVGSLTYSDVGAGDSSPDIFADTMVFDNNRLMYTSYNADYDTRMLAMGSTEINASGATNADLSALTLSSGTLSPTFSASTTSYTASVTNATSSITVTPTASDTNATIIVNGIVVTSGNASHSVYLSVGENTIAVTVTAEDGTTQKTYSTVVTRSFSPYVYAFDLDNLSPTLDSTYQYDYEAFALSESTNIVTAGAWHGTVETSTAALLASINYVQNNAPVGQTFEKLAGTQQARFSPDGKYLFLSYLSTTTNNWPAIARFPCSAPFVLPYDHDFTTASGVAAAIDQVVVFDSQDSSAWGLPSFVFKSDGLKLVVLDNTHDEVWSFTLSTAWDLSTLSFDSGSYTSIASTTPRQMEMKSDGSVMWILDGSSTLYEYTLSTPWDVTSIGSATSVSLENGSGGSPDGAIYQLWWADANQESFWIRGSGNDNFYKYTMTTAWDASTISNTNYSATFTGYTCDTSPASVCFEATDTSLRGSITCTTKGNTLSMCYSGAQNAVFTPITTMMSVTTNSSGSKLWALDLTDAIYECDISSWSIMGITSSTGDYTYSLASVAPETLRFANDALYLGQSTGDKIYQIDLDGNGSLSTATAFNATTTPNLVVTASDSVPRAIDISEDYLFVTGSTNDQFDRYDVTTYDVTTGTNLTSGYDFLANDGWSLIREMQMNTDGTQLWIACDDPDGFAYYAVSPAYSATGLTETAVPDITNWVHNSQLFAFWWGDSGTRLYFIDSAEILRHYSVQEDHLPYS